MPGGAEWRARDPRELIALRKGRPQDQIGKISGSSVKRIEGGERVTEGTGREYVSGLHTATLTMQPFEELFLHDPEKPGEKPDYSWQQIQDGAVSVAKQVFEEFRPDAILTFAGASAIFTGMVCFAAKDIGEVFRTPIYTAMLVNKACPEPDWCDTILTEPEDPDKQFKILVPKIVFTHKRVVVIDDTLITGVTMRALRSQFSKRHDILVKFACAVCHSGLLTKDKLRLRPIVGIEEPVTKDNFYMPWGKAICFEDLPL